MTPRGALAPTDDATRDWICRPGTAGDLVPPVQRRAERLDTATVSSHDIADSLAISLLDQ